MYHLGKLITIYRHTKRHRLDKPSLLKNEPIITLPKSQKSTIFQETRPISFKETQFLIVGRSHHILK